MKKSSLAVALLMFLSLSFIAPRFLSENAGATIWGPEQQISTDLAEEYQGQPDIAIEGGEVHVVWADAREGRYGIGYQHFDGTDWQPEQLIVEETDASVRYPRVAVENGRVHVVYERRPASGDWDIYHTHFDGVDWQPKQEISSDIATENQSRADVDVENGVVHVVWTDRGDGDQDVYYRRFNGIAWEPEEEISIDQGTENQGGPSADALNGEVHVVWGSDFNDSFDIYYRHWNGAAWEPEQVIVTDPLKKIQGSPSVAVEEENIYVVWMDQRDMDQDVYFRSYNGTAWQPEQEISADTIDENQHSASIAVANGNVHVVWNEYEDGDSDIRYRRFDGVTWQPEQEISVDSGSEEQILPSIAAFGAQVHVVWEKQVDWMYYDVSYRHHDGSDWMPIEKRGFDDGPESELYADISVIGDRVHFIWMDWNDVDTDIFYRYLNGTTWEPEQELSTDTLWERQG
ncbi:MAG: BNR repeat-containing protein, partial [Candidatus Thermoplasmatota archaeon]|nr:BNR repeat-containing protein [Candidatus Thermoplasmatota archaeon]